MSPNQETSSIFESSFDETPSETVPKYLPPDMIFEILTRTSLETLDACKLVCDEWNLMTRESSFMPLYCDRTKASYGYFVQEMIRNDYFSMFVSPGQHSSIRNIPSDMRILASCDQGILCCLRRIGVNFRYYVGKPATQQWQPLPNPKLRYQTAAIAIMVMEARPLLYKIIRLSKQGCIRDIDMYRCEIFDSKAWTWTTLPHLNLPDSEIIYANPSLSCSNSIHWLTNEDNVLQFHKATQSFNIFPLPKSVVKNQSYQCKQLVEYQGRLGLTCLTQEGNMEIWIMQKDQSNSTEWKKKMVVNIQSLGSTVNYPSPLAFYNDGIVFMKAFNEVVFYKLQDRSFSRLKLDHRLTVAEEVFEFRSDFEPVDLRICT